MEHLWIWGAVTAAVCQALRYAGLKELNQHLPAFVTSYARIIFALPLLLVHLAVVLWWTNAPLPAMSPRFFVYSALTAAGQFFGTVLLVRLFRLGNFAVGTMIARADAMMTAVIGTLLFSERVTSGGWIAIAVTVAGVMIISAARMPAAAWAAGETSLGGLLFGPATRLGLVIALINGLSFLTLREAILELKSSGGFMVDAAVAGTAMTLISCVLLGVYLMVSDRANLLRLRHHLPVAGFIGFVSGIGTAAWFLATALTNASYVAAVGQVQIVVALAISRYWFRETTRPLELAGIAVILVGVLMFRFL